MSERLPSFTLPGSSRHTVFIPNADTSVNYRTKRSTTAQDSVDHQHHDDQQQNQNEKQGSSASSSPSLARKGRAIPIEIRWGVDPRDLRQLWRLHEVSFGVAYQVGYYRALIKSGAFISLVAFTTEAAYRTVLLGEEEIGGDEEEARVAAEAHQRTGPSAAATASSPLSSSSAASGSGSGSGYTHSRSKSFVGSSASAAVPVGGATPLSDEDREEIDEFIRLHELKAAGTEEQDGFTAVVGVVVGQLGYGRYGPTGRLFTNPSGYLGNLAVAPELRGCGIGDLIMHTFLEYITAEFPVRASAFLHYDARAMYALAIEKPTSASAAAAASAVSASRGAGEEEMTRRIEVQEGEEGCRQSASFTKDEAVSADTPNTDALLGETGVAETRDERYSFLSSLARSVWPEYYEWRDDRRAREARRQIGITDDDVKIITDSLDNGRLSPQAREKTDPVVQVGVGEVWLHCIATEQRLIDFYVKRGFTVSGVLPKYYEIGDKMVDACQLVYARRQQEDGTVAAMAAARRGRRAAAAAAAKTLQNVKGVQDEGGQRLDAEVREEEQHGDTEASQLSTATTSDSSSFPSAAAAAACESGEHQGESFKRHPKWLTPSLYSDVVDVDLRAMPVCQREWMEYSECGGGDDGDREWTWQDYAKAASLILNAVAILVCVVVLAYSYGAKVGV